MSFLWCTVEFVLFVSLSGYLLLSRSFDRHLSATERWALYLGIGFWSVAFSISLILLLPLHRLGFFAPQLIPVCSLIVIAGAWVRWKSQARVETLPVSRMDKTAFGIAVLAFVIFFIGVDDPSFHKGCWYESLDEVSRETPDGCSPLLRIRGDERYGNVLAVLMPYNLCGQAFNRFGHGFFAAVLFLSACALGRRLTGRTWPGIVSAAMLLVTDDVFEFQVLNQNAIGAWTAILFLLLLAPVYRWQTVSKTFLGAMLVSSRYIAVLGMGALFLNLWRRHPRAVRGGRLLRIVRFVLLFGVFSVPTLVVIVSDGDHVQSILNARLLNFPFHPELVRTPFNPFPLWIGWPVHWFRQWGLIGVSVVTIGWVLLWRRRRREDGILSWTLYALPIVLGLLVQENWMEPEKMSIGLLLSPLAVGGMAIALHWLASPVRLRRCLILGVSLLAWGAAAFMAGSVLRVASFPEDVRMRRIWPGLPSETPEFLAFERDRWLSPSWTPLPGGPGVLQSMRRKPRAALRAALPAIFPRYRKSARSLITFYLEEIERNRSEVERAAAPPAAPARERIRRLVLDLRESPIIAADPLKVAPGSAGHPVTLDFSDGRECVMGPVDGLRLAYWNRPIRVLACRSDFDEVYVILAPPLIPCPELEEGSPATGPGTGIWTEPPEMESWTQRHAVELRIPEATRRVFIVESVYIDPERTYARAVDLRPNGTLEHGAPHIWRHN